MSTKTTFKRVALVAVASMGFGLLTAMPSQAATVTAVTAGTSAPARVGVWSGQTLITLATDLVAVDSTTVTAQITSGPTGSTAAGLKFVSGVGLSTRGVAVTTTSGTDSRVSTATNQQAASSAGIAYAQFTATDKATEVVGLQLNADVAGSYTILVTGNGNNASGYADGAKSVSYTITTAGAPVAMTLSAVNSTTYDADSNGALVKVSLKDANGVATSLGLNESLTLASANTATLTNGLAGANAFLGNADFTRGTAIFRVVKDVTADTVDIITVAGSGTLPASFNGQTSITILAADAFATGETWTVANNAALLTYATNGTDVSPTATGYGLTATVTAPATGGLADTYATKATITDVSGLITGIPGAVFTRGIAVAKAATTFSSTTGGVALGAGGQVTIAFEGTTRTYTGKTASTTYTISAISPATVTSALAGTNTFTAKVTNEYGSAVSGAAIVGKIKSGRNAASTAKNLVSDASGFVSYSITDAGTTGISDVVSLSLDGTTGEVTATISYATIAVDKVVMTGGNTDAGVTAATPVVKPIEADNTPESATIDIAAKVTDANGVLLSGVAVVFTISPADGAAFTTTTATSYTTSTGVATGKMFAWKAGTYTVTATAGGKTGTATATFANARPADARVVSATTDGSVVTAKVVDRFGNPVAGVRVYASKSGTGSFGGGSTRTFGDTDITGTVEFVYDGNAEVTVSTINPATLGDKGSGQTCAAAGNLDCPDDIADVTAFTATTAGTVTVNAKNYGSSLAPAGVNKASVTVANDSASAAADASAEATDAANAATDAANAAAEAADAATAAAQDAADAVAALSTSVSAMISDLKRQITALTNLVIKIQRKVKA